MSFKTLIVNYNMVIKAFTWSFRPHNKLLFQKSFFEILLELNYYKII